MIDVVGHHFLLSTPFAVCLPSDPFFSDLFLYVPPYCRKFSRTYMILYRFRCVYGSRTVSFLDSSGVCKRRPIGKLRSSFISDLVSTFVRTIPNSSRGYFLLTRFWPSTREKKTPRSINSFWDSLVIDWYLIVLSLKSPVCVCVVSYVRDVMYQVFSVICLFVAIGCYSVVDVWDPSSFLD